MTSPSHVWPACVFFGSGAVSSAMQRGAGGRWDQEATGCILAASRKPNLGRVLRTKVQVPKVFPVRPSSFVFFLAILAEYPNRLRPRCRFLLPLMLPCVTNLSRKDQQQHVTFFVCFTHTIWHRKGKIK